MPTMRMQGRGRRLPMILGLAGERIAYLAVVAAGLALAAAAAGFALDVAPRLPPGFV